MKTRKIIRVFSAILLSVAGAVISAFLIPTHAYVVVKNTATDEEYVCRDSGADCEQDTPFSCRVVIVTSIYAGTKTVIGHPASSCTSSLGGYNYPVAAYISVYDALDYPPF